MKNKIQHIFSAMALTLVLSYTANAQTTAQKIGKNPTSIAPSAVLDIESDNKGVLFPRMALTATTDATTIASPATGLTVYNTATAGTSPNNVTPGYYYWNGTKWTKLAVEATPIAFARTVYVNTALPSTATIFDETNPAATNNNTLKADVANLYIGNDGSTWTYDIANSTYKTYAVAPSTPFNLANSTTDAGSNKTSAIWRTGNLGIGMNNPIVPLDVQSSLNSLYVTTAKFLAPNNTTAGNSTLLNFGVSATTGNTADWRYVYQGNGSASNRVDFGMSGYAAPMISYLNNGKVGIGISTPVTSLQINNPLIATAFVNANAQVLRLSRPSSSDLKWDNIAQFNLGSYSTAIAANSRLDLALTNGGDNTTLSNVMTWQANGNVGINNTAPSAPLVVQGVTGTGALKLIAPSVAAGDNWWMGFGHGTSTDATDRARIGVDIKAAGAGRLFFTTGAGGAQTRAMFIDESQRVGIGTSSPASKLDVSTGVTTANSIVNATGSINDYLQYNVQNTSTGTQAQSGYSATADNGSATSGFAWVGINNSNFNFPTSYNIGGANDVSFIGSGQDLYVANANNTKSIIFSTGKATTPFFGEQMRILNNGNVGIGTSSPTSRLEVDGAATNKTAFNAAAGTIIDFSKSNLAYTTANPGAFTLSNLKDGGTYTLAVQGTVSGLSTFSASGFTFKSPNNGPTTSLRETIYTFIVMGTKVYVYMTAGINDL